MAGTAGSRHTGTMTAVLLAFLDGSKQLVDDVHVHGVRDGMLQLATGAPGAGLSAEIVRTVPVGELSFAETCQKAEDDDESDDSDGSTWYMSWNPDA